MLTAVWAKDERGRSAPPQGGHSLTGLADLTLVHETRPRRVYIKVVRTDPDELAAGKPNKYQKFWDNEKKWYERLQRKNRDGGGDDGFDGDGEEWRKFLPVYYGLAQIEIGAGGQHVARARQGTATGMCFEVAGDSLIRYLRQQQEVSTLRQWDQIAEALGYLNIQGLCHGDLKPSNVVVGEDGRARLIDLGKAYRIANAGAEGPHRPATGLYEAAAWSAFPSAMEYTKAANSKRTRGLLRSGWDSGAVDTFALGMIGIDLTTGIPLEGLPGEFREPVRQAYCKWADVPPDPSEYFEWVAELDPDWDRTPVDFLVDLGRFEMDRPKERRGRGAHEPETLSYLQRLRHRLVALTEANGPACVDVWRRMTHPNPHHRQV